MTKEQGATVSCNTTDFCIREITHIVFYLGCGCFIKSESYGQPLTYFINSSFTYGFSSSSR